MARKTIASVTAAYEEQIATLKQQHLDDLRLLNDRITQLEGKAAVATTERMAAKAASESLEARLARKLNTSVQYGVWQWKVVNGRKRRVHNHTKHLYCLRHHKSGKQEWVRIPQSYIDQM